jgi:hypothetical protein
MAGIILGKKRVTMTSMRHLPRGQLGDAAKQQKNSYLDSTKQEFNEINLFLGKA